jgi:hypothetical protein
MKRAIIICEGHTEKEFCNNLLSKYFDGKNISIQSLLINKTGGNVKWSRLKPEILRHLKHEKDVSVTTLIDYYGLKAKQHFPKWDEALKINDKNKKMDFLEDAMRKDIEEPFRNRYLPYIQLHEFEGLLFNDIQIFYEQIPKKDLVKEDELKQTFRDFPNPEMINDSSQTAPSKRLARIIKGYDKIVYGHYLAEAIGLDNIRKKCFRFNNWLNQIGQL